MLFFFAVFFFAAAFLFFAIAALLAMDHGGVASVHIANRSALHFIYYSTMKKAAFHLRKSVRAAASQAHNAPIPPRRRALRRNNAN